MTLPDPPSALERACRLIRIPSESSHPSETPPDRPEEAVALELRDAFASAGMEAQWVEVMPGRPNLVVRIPNPGAPRVLITGHMDTVSARGDAHGFNPVEQDGRLYGRGACDDKGPLAAAVHAIIQGGGRRRKYDLTFLATVGEEVGMHGARAYAEAHAGTVSYDLILGLEPTGLKPITAHKGVFRFRVTTRGRSGHSSEPENAVNAIDRMVPLMQALNAFGASLARGRACPRTGSPTLAITRIQGGQGENVVPDRCEICVDMRTIPGLSDSEIAAAIAAQCGGDGVVIEPLLSHPAMISEPGGPAWSGFTATLEAAGLDRRPATAKYGTDCAYLQTLGPCVVWGPGAIAQAHGANEYISIRELEQAAQILSAWLS